MLRHALLIASPQPEHAAAMSEPISKLLNDSEPILRSTSGWALRELRIPGWQLQIHSRLEIETDPEVRQHLAGLCDSQSDD
jgi:3-methyladenine DNA glycosylase AlkD